MKITDLEDLYNMFFVLFKKAGVINDDGLVNDDKEFHGLLLKMVDNINYIKTFRSTVLDDDTNLVNELIIFIQTVDINYIENEKDFDEFASNNYIISSSQSDNGLYALVISVNNSRIISSGEVGSKDINGTSQMKKSLNIISESEDPALHVTRYTPEQMADINRKIEESEKRKKAIVDDYIINKKRVKLSNIEVANGNVMIFDNDNEIILLQDEYNLDYDRDSLNTDDGTVVIIRNDIKLNNSLESSFKDNYLDANRELHCLSESSDVDIEELTQEELRELTKVQRSTETIEVENVVISFDAFDSYASKHHIIGWNLATPNTLSIKFIEGITPESTISKFHDMMDNLDTGWINSYQMSELKSFEESTEFLADLRNMIIDEKDIADEFIARVNKHNIFVRNSISKIRTSLLDMESDFERSLKNEVNLSIDWDKLTAYAAKKERTEHRVNGVRIISGNDGVKSNVVRVNSEFENGDFFIPTHLLTDEICSKYVLESCPHYIEDVPDYAFYEVQLNGHFILIENTKL